MRASLAAPDPLTDSETRTVKPRGTVMTAVVAISPRSVKCLSRSTFSKETRVNGMLPFSLSTLPKAPVRSRWYRVARNSVTRSTRAPPVGFSHCHATVWHRSVVHLMRNSTPTKRLASGAVDVR